MLTRVLAAPPVLLVLLALILLIEIFTFLVLFQPAAILRFVLLLALMLFTLRGSRIARYLLIFLLVAGGGFLFFSAFKSSASFAFVFVFHYLPSTILITTACYILFSQPVKKFLSRGRENVGT